MLPFSRLTYPSFKAFSAAGQPLSGGLLYTYEPGTTTPKTTYATEDYSAPLPNPIVLNSLGEMDIFLSGQTKLVLKDSTGVTIWTRDSGANEALSSQLLVDNLTALRAIPTPYGQAFVAGRAIARDGGQGLFYYSSGAAVGTYVDDDGMTIVPAGGDGSAAWVRSEETVNVAYFGAAMDTAAREKAVLRSDGYINTIKDGKLVEFELLGELALPRLAGQIAQNSEEIIVHGNKIYTLSKGSYSLLDHSYLSTFEIKGDSITQIGAPISLGLGADVRAMTATDEFLYVVVGPAIWRFNLTGSIPVYISSTARPNAGFVQTCKIIGDLLILPVWGTAAIETYIVRFDGSISLNENYTMPTSLNVSIVDGCDGSYFVINHSATVSQLSRFWLKNDMITNLTTYTIPAMVNCRYGVVDHGRLYTGSFGVGNALEIDITQTPPVLIQSFINVSNSVKVGDFLFGYGALETLAIDTVYNNSFVLNSDLRLWYPRIIGDYIFSFRMGAEAAHASALANDSVMGQTIVVFRKSGSMAVSPDKLPKHPQTPLVATVTNGTIIKYPDGRMKQHYRMALGTIADVTFPSVVTWTYPTPFISVPTVLFQSTLGSATVSLGLQSILVSGAIQDTSTAKFGLARINAEYLGPTTLISVNCFATGFWK